LNESGHYSIAGFFFQLLASADDAMKLFFIESDQSNSTAVFQVERLGQDAVAYPDKGRCRMIQYKYSSVGAEIGPPDIREVLVAFKKSLDYGNLSASDVDLYLTTNRPYDAAATSWSKAKNETDFKFCLHKNLPLKSAKALPFTLLWPIFKQMKLDFKTQGDVINDIAKLGGQYGMRCHEIPPGILRVIGLLTEIAKSPGSRLLSREKLIEALVQHPNPFRLNGRDSIDLQKREVTSFRQKETQISATISRSVSGTIASMISTKPIVIIKGEGGMGKSVAMSDAAAINIETAEQPPAFALIIKAADLDRNSVQSAIARWRNQGSNPDGNNLNHSLERLRGSSPFFPTIAVYVDGIDERGGFQSLSFDARHSLMDLVNEANESFRTQSIHKMSIILSCRTEAELQGLGGGGFPAADLPVPISVGEFDYDEVETLCSELKCDQAVANRIKAHFASRSSGRTTRPTTLASVDPNRAKLLCRPILWRFFAALQDADKHAFLDGTQDALDALAREYVTWFFNKVTCRIGQEQRDIAIEAFRAVGQRFVEGKNQTPAAFKEDWIEPLREIGCFGIHHRKFFDEGLSAGVFEVIDTDRQFWQWKYDWLRDGFAKGRNWYVK